MLPETGSVKWHDLGCSYGSLAWIVCQIVKQKLPKLDFVARGDELELERFVQGAYYSLIMLRKDFNTTKEYLLSYKCQLRHRNITEQKTIDSEIIFVFDKAFIPSLCLHILLIVIASEEVKYFITCKPSHSTEYGSDCFKYGEIIKACGCFTLLGQVDGCKMNGGECSGTFSFYARDTELVVDDIISKLWTYLMHNFPSKRKDISRLFMKWEQAENKDIGGNKHIFHH